MDKSPIENHTDDDMNVKLGETLSTSGKQQDDKSYDFSGDSVFLMTLLGVVTVVFCYLTYLIIL